MTKSLKFAFICGGSDGDIIPYIALAVQLKNRGHKIQMLMHKEGESLCRKYDLEFTSLDDETTSFIATLFATFDYSRLRKFSAFCSLITLLRKFLQQLLITAPKAVSEADVLLYNHIGAFVGPHLAEYYKLPAILVILTPDRKTAYFPSSFVDFPTWLGDFGNLLSHFVAEQFIWQLLRSPINKWRRKTLKLKRSSFLGPFYDSFGRTIPTIIAFSPQLIPPPKDWNFPVYMTGFLRLSEPSDWSPSKELQTFLDNGSPPIYIGFGSWSKYCPNRNPG